MFKQKQIPRILVVFSLLTVLGCSILANKQTVFAEVVTCGNGETIELAESDSGREGEICASRGGVVSTQSSTPESTVPNGAKFAADCSPEDPNQSINAKNCAIVAYTVTAINILSSIVGVVVVLMIAVGGIQYAASRDNPQAAVKAKERIRNAILALVAYLFIYAFLQYLIPGGVL